MNLREYYSKEEEYTKKELINFQNNPSESNRNKVLKKRIKFKEKIIKEHQNEIVYLEDVESISAGMICTRDKRDQLLYDLKVIRRVDER